MTWHLTAVKWWRGILTGIYKITHLVPDVYLLIQFDPIFINLILILI